MRPNGLTGAVFRSDCRSEVALSVASISPSPTEAISTRYGCGSAARAREQNAVTAIIRAITVRVMRCEDTPMHDGNLSADAYKPWPWRTDIQGRGGVIGWPRFHF